MWGDPEEDNMKENIIHVYFYVVMWCHIFIGCSKGYVCTKDEFKVLQRDISNNCFHFINSGHNKMKTILNF